MRHGRLSVDLARGLQVLRKRIEASKIPPSSLDETLNFATWNIREFGKKARKPAGIHYIAEILSQFDLIAITELRSNLRDLQRVLDILGPYWDIVYSDFGTDAAGNRERMAYLFDKRMVYFTGLAAEADEPRKKVGTEYLPKYTWWRSPYMASFAAGNFDFVVITVHIRWGGSVKERVKPLAELANWVDKRRKDKDVADKDIIVVGDMNIPSLRSDTFKAISQNGRGLQVPKALLNLDNKEATTNLSRESRYDQILHYPTLSDRFTDKAGVLDFFKNDWRALFPQALYPDFDKHDFTFQLSDHLPLWVQLDTWIEDEQLNAIIARSGG